MKKEHLEFVIYCVGNLADHLSMNASQVYSALRTTGTLQDYLIPCYDVLHTFSKDYLINELTDVLKERGGIS